MLSYNLYFALFVLFSIAISASAISQSILGISPDDEKYYQHDVIKCKDGSKKFGKLQLNDNFCDCPDGTDEPGTSACPDGKFYCQNAGHTPLILFSSRVNDGTCDCCDGSDEYDGKLKCQNTCWEAGKVARDKLKKKIATYQEGVNVRKKEVAQANEAFSRDESNLLKLKNEQKILKELVKQLREKKEQIEKAEEEQRLKEENEKKLREAEQNATKKNKQPAETKHEAKEVNNDSSGSLSQDPTKDDGENVLDDESGSNAETRSVASFDNPAGKVSEEVKDATDKDIGISSESSNHSAKEEQEKQDDTEGLSKEELGRIVASRWTGENVGQKTHELDGSKEGDKHASEDGNLDTPHAEPHEDYDDDDDDGYVSDTDEDNRKYATDDVGEIDAEDEHYDPVDSYHSDVEEDFSDSKLQHSLSWLDKLQQTVRNILQAVNLFKTPVDLSEASEVKKKFEESSQKLSKIESRISSLSEKLKHDFGPEKEFYSFYDRCFENKQNKYVYKVCPFKKASQIEGHSTTQLGQWDKFDESYRIMKFSNGDSCWNGPDRSLKARLRCGLQNEITDVDEPSRCEYIAVLSTPALCLEEKLKELQQKLDLMNMNQPTSHDEL